MASKAEHDLDHDETGVQGNPDSEGLAKGGRSVDVWQAVIMFTSARIMVVIPRDLMIVRHRNELSLLAWASYDL